MRSRLILPKLIKSRAFGSINAVFKKLSTDLQPSGVRDWVPYQLKMRDEVFEIIRRVSKKHGGEEIETSIFEFSELLKGKYGEDSKLIFDIANEPTSLRYDLTVPFARFLAASSIDRIKRFQIGKVYRNDKGNASKGKFKEFHQCDFDIAGDYPTMIADAEILTILSEILTELPLGSFTIKVNHRVLIDAIFEICGVPNDKFRAICSAIDKLDKLTWEEVKTEMIAKGLTSEISDKIGEYVRYHDQPRVLLKLLRDKQLFQSHSRANEILNEMELLFNYLEVYDTLQYVVFDMSLARGLDYYTGIIFEAVLNNDNMSSNDNSNNNNNSSSSNSNNNAGSLLNNQQENKVLVSSLPSSSSSLTSTGYGSIAGGGRYDELTKMIPGYTTRATVPCIGMSIGVDRILSILDKKIVDEETRLRSSSQIQVYVSSIGAGYTLKRMEITKLLWNSNIATEYKTKDDRKFRMDLEEVVLLRNIPYVVFFGEDELKKGVVRIKDMKNRIQKDVALKDLVSELLLMGCKQLTLSSGNNNHNDNNSDSDDDSILKLLK